MTNTIEIIENTEDKTITLSINDWNLMVSLYNKATDKIEEISKKEAMKKTGKKEAVTYEQQSNEIELYNNEIEKLKKQLQMKRMMLETIKENSPINMAEVQRISKIKLESKDQDKDQEQEDKSKFPPFDLNVCDDCSEKNNCEQYNAAINEDLENISEEIPEHLKGLLESLKSNSSKIKKTAEDLDLPKELVGLFDNLGFKVMEIAPDKTMDDINKAIKKIKDEKVIDGVLNKISQLSKINE